MLVWCCLILYIVILKFSLGKLEDNKRKRIFLILASLGVIFVLGSRYPYYEVERDLEVYYNHYRSMINTPWKSIVQATKANNATSRFGVGYIILNKCLATIIPWPQFILYFVALVSVGTMAYFIYKNSSRVFESFILYITIDLMVYHLTMFRQSIAIGICLVAIELIKKKKFWWFIFFVMIAITMHVSAVVFIFAYFFINREINLSQIILTIGLIVGLQICGGLILILGNDLIGHNYEGFTGNVWGGLILVAIYTVTITFIYLQKKDTVNRRIGTNMTAVGLGIFLLRYTVTRVVERVVYYFTPGIVIALPEMIYGFKDSKDYIWIDVLVTMLAILMFIRTLLNSDFIPYRFFWS